MRIFINSCGYDRRDPNHEYHWRNVLTNLADGEAEQLLRKPMFEGYSLGEVVQSDSRQPSVAFGRNSGKLYLLVTRLASNRRNGSQGDRIYNGLLLEAEERDALLLRVLVANLLQTIPDIGEDFQSLPEGSDKSSILATQVDGATRFDEEHGFCVDLGFELMRQLEEAVEQLNLYPPTQRQPFPWRGRMGHNCSKLRWELAYELKHFSFPLADGLLVLVTGIKSESVLRESYVWRGLTLLTDSVLWEPLPKAWKLQRVREQQEASRAGGVVSLRA